MGTPAASLGNLRHVNARAVPVSQQSRSKTAEQGASQQSKGQVSSARSESWCKEQVSSAKARSDQSHLWMSTGTQICNVADEKINVWPLTQMTS